MAHTLTLELPEDVYQLLVRAAKLRGQTPEEVAIDRLRNNGTQTTARELTEEERAEAMARLKRFAGAVSVPDPTNADNEAIDRDLAAEYEATHDEEQ